MISKRFLVILLAVIIAIGLGVFFISTKQISPTQQVTPTPLLVSPVPTSSTTDETANWKTYRNEQHGFEVKYPGNWRVNTPEVQEGDFIQIDNYLTDREGGEKTMQILIYKDTTKPENGFDVEDSNYLIDNLPTKTYYFIPNRDFGLDDTGPEPRPMVVIRMEKNNKSYRFLLFNTDKITGVYNQIISTFKFAR